MTLADDQGELGVAASPTGGQGQRPADSTTLCTQTTSEGGERHPSASGGACEQATFGPRAREAAAGTEPTGRAGRAGRADTAATGREGPGAGRRLGHRPELDGLRAVALLTVVAHHLGVLMWQGHPWWFAPGGHVGLDLFFSLSGFLITALLLSESHRTGGIGVRRFVWRRALRLVPALVGLLAGLLVASVATDRYPARDVLATGARVLTFTTNLDVDGVIIEAGHTWSLGVEAHFYLLWGLAVAAAARWARRPHVTLAVLAGAGAAAVAIARAVLHARGGGDGAATFDLYVGTAHRLDGPLIGALAGVAWAAGWLERVPARLAGWAAGVAGAGLALAAVETTPLAAPYYRGLFSGVALCGAVLVAGSLQAAPDGRLRRLLSRPALTAAGTVSYSTYLWHLPVTLYVERNTTDWPLACQLAVAVAATAAIGAASYHLTERPFLGHRARAAR